MIYRNGKLMLTVQRLIQGVGQQSIGAIYKGSQLVWLTVYDAIRSCFGSGTWLQDRSWISDDTWKNN